MASSQELNSPKRTYQGERDARELLSYLNGTDQRNKVGRERVTKMVETFHQILLLMQQNSEWVTAMRRANEEAKGTDAQLTRLIKKRLKQGGVFPSKPETLEAAERSLAEDLAKYERRPIFGIQRAAWEFTWGPTLRGGPEGDEWATFAESKAVDGLIELGRQRLLPSVQKCECGTWFFARFSHQQFCSARCASKHQQKSPEFKAYRREYMREYYRAKKAKS